MQFGMNSNAHYFLRNDVKNKRSSENRFQSFRRPFIFSGKPSLSSAQHGVVDVFLDAGGDGRQAGVDRAADAGPESIDDGSDFGRGEDVGCDSADEA